MAVRPFRSSSGPARCGMLPGREGITETRSATHDREAGDGARHAPATSEPAVALGDVSVTLRLAGGKGYTAIERASLSVASSEFVAIVGPTGCGKSTLLNVAAGLLAPSAGTVSIFGARL